MEILDSIPYKLDRQTTAKKLHISLEGRHADLLDELLQTAKEIIKPKAAFKTAYLYEKGEDTVQVDDVLFKSRILRVNLEEVGRVFPYIVTCGEEFDRVSQSTGDMLRKYYLDEMANIVLGLAQEYLIGLLGEKYSLGKTSRMNPGSLRDWPLEQQRPLFALFGEDQIRESLGVKLTSTFLMIPVKSVSGIIFQSEKSFKSCQLCPREDCSGRRAAYNEDRLNSYF
jgi:hypothetical protein